MTTKDAPLKILVTGGAGFIGSHLCDRLIERGYEVRCLDNYFTGSPDNIAHLVHNPSFAFIHQDVTTPLYIDVNQIYNLACPASPVHYQSSPLRTTKTIVLGAINVLDLAERLRVPILQASTSEVYGDPTEHPQKELYWGNVNPVGSRACYDEGKRCAETLFFDYHRQLHLQTKIARIFNTYGPRMQPNDGRVIPSFIVQALKNQPITVYGDGSQTRSFCYVTDLVDGLLALMGTPATFTGPVNLGNAVELSIVDLAEQIISLTGSRSRIHLSPLPSDDPRRRKPDTTLAEQILNWRATTPLAVGLSHTIAHFESLLMFAQGRPELTPELPLTNRLDVGSSLG